MEFLEKLEAFKRKGVYGVALYFGEDVGADDMDVPVNERKLIITGRPVGYLGSIKILFTGTIQSFMDYDFKIEPTLVSNPPDKDVVDKPGFYYWGTEKAIEVAQSQESVFPNFNHEQNGIQETE